MFTLPFPISRQAFAYIRPLIQSGSASLPLAISNVWTNICAETLLPTERGIISAIGFDVDDNGTAYDYSIGSIAYKILIAQGVPIDWGNPADLTSKRGSVVSPTQTAILVQPGNQIIIQARRISANDSGARVVNALFNGIRWPITIEKEPRPTDGPIDQAVAQSLAFNV